MTKYVIHWLGGKTELVEGTDIADACRRAGIGNGALRAMDYFEEEGKEVSESDQREFDAGVKEFFNVLDEKLRTGRISHERAESFFKERYRHR